MDIAIIRAHTPNDARALAKLERKAFSNKEDWVPPSYYKRRGMHSFWLLHNGRRVGVTCLLHNANISTKEGMLFGRQRETLYIISTSVLPQFQRGGFGSIVKAWQIAYARKHGYKKIITSVRESNAVSIHLNLKFGFTISDCKEGFYADGDTGVILEKNLTT